MLFAHEIGIYSLDYGIVTTASERNELVGNSWIAGSVLYLLLEYLVNQPLVRLHFPSVLILAIQFCVQAALICGISFASDALGWYLLVVPTIALNAFGTPNTVALVAAAAKGENKGQILGTASALKSCSYALAALSTGFSYSLSRTIWRVCAAIFLAAALFCLLIIYDDSRRQHIGKQSQATQVVVQQEVKEEAATQHNHKTVQRQ